MLTWVVYDISDDKARKKISDACLDYGLERVQWSVFLGEINSNQKDELALKCKNLMDTESDSVYIFPMCKEDFKKVVLIGESFDKEYVSGELDTKIL